MAKNAAMKDPAIFVSRVSPVGLKKCLGGPFGPLRPPLSCEGNLFFGKLGSGQVLFPGERTSNLVICFNLWPFVRALK